MMLLWTYITLFKYKLIFIIFKIYFKYCSKFEITMKEPEVFPSNNFLQKFQRKTFYIVFPPVQFLFNAYLGIIQFSVLIF